MSSYKTTSANRPTLKKIWCLAAGLAIALTGGQALAATAYWTGQMQHVTTVTYKQGVSCQYNYAGQTFWRTFTGTGSCPGSVQVQ